MSGTAQCDSDPALTAQANNRSLRHAVQRNAVEQTACNSAHRWINAQQRSLNTRLSREERGLRAQLERLQLEQKNSGSGQSSVDRGSLNDEEDITVTPDYKSSYRRFSISESALFEDDVINPYPITARGSKPCDVTSGVAVAVADPSGSTETPAGLWAGDPEAIQSVRRARKPLSLRRLEQGGLGRSYSLKERPSTASSTPREPQTNSSRRPSEGSPGCSRAGSLKGASKGARPRLPSGRVRQVTRQTTSETRSSVSSLTDEGMEEIERDGDRERERESASHRRTKSLKYTKPHRSIAD